MFKVILNKDNLKESVIHTNIEYLKNPDFLCVVGSHLYGTADKDSDMDIRGFCFLPKEFLLGIKKFEQHQNLTGKEDVVVWSAEKYTKMLLNGSTIAFEMLFCNEDKIIRCSNLAYNLTRNKSVFISQRIIKGILGYAQNEWRKVLGETTRDLGAKRKEHIEQKGYSYKNAYHTIRILQCGLELARYGLITFPVSARGFLKAIKAGDVNFEDVEPLYNKYLSELESLLNTVTEKQDVEYVNDLLVKLNLRKILGHLIKLDFGSRENTN